MSSASRPLPKLGRKPAVRDHRNLKLAKYIAAAKAAGTLPAMPTNYRDTISGVSWGMMLNDNLGDCVCAGAGHTVLNWSNGVAAPGVRPTDSQVEDLYCRACGYVRGNSATDNGCTLQGVLNYWRNYGIAVGADPTTYSGTLLSGAFKAGENLICQTLDPLEVKAVVLDSKGHPMKPSQIPQWAFSGDPGAINKVSADGTQAIVSGPAGTTETVTVTDGAISSQAMINFAKDTGIYVGGSAMSLQLTAEVYPFQPGDVIVGASSGAQFKVASNNVTTFPTVHKIDGYVELGMVSGDPFNVGYPGNVAAAQADLELKYACYIFDGCFAAVNLPITAQGQSTWTVPSSLTGNGRPGSWGGHCVLILGWDANYLYFISWGQVYRMTWDFYHVYFDECFAPISGDQISLATGLSRNGFDYPLLKADQALITH